VPGRLASLRVGPGTPSGSPSGSLSIPLPLAAAATPYCHCLAPHPPHSPQPRSAACSQLQPPTPARDSVQQRSVVNSLRIWDCEPLRPASRLLGFTIVLWYGDPGDRLAVAPRCGPRCLEDPVWLIAPDSFLGRYPVAVDYHRGPVAMRLMGAAFCWGCSACGCCWRSRDGPGYFVGSPPRWISASIRLVTLTESPLSTGA
jgi:hypothetical protein